jgi:hypothetical protein
MDMHTPCPKIEEDIELHVLNDKQLLEKPWELVT